MMFGLSNDRATSQRKCAEQIVQLDESYRRELMAHLCFDRIEQKQEFLVDRFHDTDSWNETAYFMLLRSLDIKANRQAYEHLAHILPYRIFEKISFDPVSVQTLLLGCSGLLSRLSQVCVGDKSIAELQAIFEYEAHKYSLETMDIRDWNLVGCVGDNHPIIRLLQLASLISRHEHLLNDILDCRNRRDVEMLFCLTSVPRWAFRFLSEANPEGAISRTKAQMLGINVVAQIQIFYSEYTLRNDLDSRGIDLLEQLPAENNMFVARWNKLGVKAENALESQALLQLSKEYCSRQNCERCPLRRFMEAE